VGRQAVILIQPVIQHAPWRDDRRVALRRLLSQLGPGARWVADHDREGVWPTSRRCWIRAFGAGAEWALVIQDDAILPVGYLDACRAQIAAHEAAGTGANVILHYHYRKTANPPGHWYRTQDAVSGVAILMRSAEARRFIAWADQLAWERKTFSDCRLAFWLLATASWAYVTVPSCVDHDVTIPSSIGGSATGPGRVARDYQPDLTGIDWTVRVAPRIPVAGPTRRLYEKVCHDARV
jgi:hypothetical protein